MASTGRFLRRASGASSTQGRQPQAESGVGGRPSQRVRLARGGGSYGGRTGRGSGSWKALSTAAPSSEHEKQEKQAAPESPAALSTAAPSSECTAAEEFEEASEEQHAAAFGHAVGRGSGSWKDVAELPEEAAEQEKQAAPESPAALSTAAPSSECTASEDFEEASEEQHAAAFGHADGGGYGAGEHLGKTPPAHIPEHPVAELVPAVAVEAVEQPAPEARSVADDEAVVRGLAATLEHLAAMAPRKQAMTMFHSSSEPPMSIRQYLARLRAYFGCSTECFVLALVYIDRLIQRRPALVVSKLSCHRLLLCSLTLATKFNDDHYYANAFYAKAGGLALQELNKLEVFMLQLLEYRLVVPESEYKAYLDSVNASAGVDCSARALAVPQ